MPTTVESVGVIAVLSLALKLMLLPSHQSIEFERQRVWLALTHNEPMTAWYGEESSARNGFVGGVAAEPTWPLNYPPVFAYFKLVAGQFVYLFVDPNMLKDSVGATSCSSSPALVRFERLSVIVMDSGLLLGILLYCTTWPSTTTTDMAWSRNKVVVVVALILFNPGLIIVDHIWLHYTGFAVGIMLMCIAFFRRGDDRGDLLGAIMLIVAIMFDHTYAPIVPLLTIYLFRHFCFKDARNAGLALASSRNHSYSDGRRRSKHGASISSSEGFTSEGESAFDRAMDMDGNEEDDEAEEGEVSGRINAVRRIAMRKRRTSSTSSASVNGSGRSLLNNMREMDIPTACAASKTKGVVLDELKAMQASTFPRLAALIEKQKERLKQQGQPFQEHNSSKPQASTSAASLGSSMHRRNSSEPIKPKMEREKRSFQIDTSLTTLLQRPRARSSYEFSSQDRGFSLLRFAVLLTLAIGTIAFLLFPFLVAHRGDVYSFLGNLFARLTARENSAVRSYWAPNVWALYTGFDKVLLVLCNLWEQAGASAEMPDLELEVILLSRSELQVLPLVQPWMAIVGTAVAMSPALSQVWHLPHPSLLMPVFIYCMTSAFMLGYHTHEKSVLLIIVPLTLVSCDSTLDARLYLLMTWTAHISLLPILETADLKTLKPVLLILHFFSSFIALDQYHIMARQARRIRVEPNGGGVSLARWDRAYLYGLGMVYIFAEVVHPVLHFFIDEPALQDPFLPLMSISLYCAIGLVYCWILAFQQITRKVVVIESYQWSPHFADSQPPELDSSGERGLLAFSL